MTQYDILSKSDVLGRYKAPILILFLFLLTIPFRTHSFTDSVRGSHVWLTAHTIMTVQIWLDDGISKHHFSPIYTYDNDADRNIRSLTSGITDSEGNYYYVSYGPFSFLLAFVIFKLIGTSPTIFSLQVINLLIHLVTSWLIYLLIRRFYRQDKKNEVFGPALLGAFVYLFSMHPLWCHTYVYFADTLIQLLWVWGIYLALGFFLYDKIKEWRYVALFGLLTFISIYTEWLALFFAAVVFCIAAVYAIRDKYYIRLLGTIAVATSLALGLFVLQFASINDLSTFIDASLHKYLQRSGYESTWHITKVTWQLVLKDYQRLYYPIAGIILFLLFTSIASKRVSSIPNRGKELSILMMMLFIPIVLHHVIFLGFTQMHDFALLKSSVPGVVIIAILYNRCTYHVIPSQKKFFKTASLIVIGIMLTLSLISFYDFDKFEDNLVYERVSEVIRKTSTKEEVLFVLSESDRTNGIMVFLDGHRAISPQVQMMTGRNVLGIEKRSLAFDHLKKYGLTKGRIYTVNRKGYIINIEAISTPLLITHSD